jgi:uncharacterized protein
MMVKVTPTWIALLVATLVLAACGAGSTALPGPASTTVAVTATTDGTPPATPTAVPVPVLTNPSTVTPSAPSFVATPALTPTAASLLVAPSTTEPAPAPTGTPAAPAQPISTPAPVPSHAPNPLQIAVMRQKSYPGSALTFEQTLAPGANYNQYVVSYRSDGYKIYALMTIPKGQKPATGWPVIIFNHGYIQPDQYVTTERYVAYVDAIARRGYIVFKSDYRGHGRSEGPTTGGGYGSPGYTDDVLNALASLQAYPDADPKRIGMWGHSMGGSITLRAMVISKAVRAGVIWAGAVGPYPDIFALGNAPYPARSPGETVPNDQRGWRQQLTATYGSPAQNPQFWASVSPNSYLADISGPLQLDHSTTDPEVNVAASRLLEGELQAVGKTVELYTYPGDDHNLSASLVTAMQRSIAFFDKYVKGS